MNYQFREKQLGAQFRSDDILKIKELVTNSITFSIACMPGVGASIFLRYLACQDFANFIYIDAYTLTSISKLNLYQLIYSALGGDKRLQGEKEVLDQCRDLLQNLVQKNDRIVIILNRFDQLKKIFDNQLFADLISLRNVKNDQIVFIFTGNRPYVEILPDNISGDKVNLFTKTFYLKPYSKTDLSKLLTVSAQSSIHTPEFIEKAIQLCGGHYQLLQLFLKSERLDPPFIDRYVRFQLKELYDFLNYHQKKQLEKIAFNESTTGLRQVVSSRSSASRRNNKIISEVDQYLIDIGMVKLQNNSYQLFTPLLTEYLRMNIPMKLPAKEKKLFNLLKKRLNNVVTKDEIFTQIWADNPDSASDWALNALIYRLKKNPGFISSDYIIENHKKLGYSLIKNS